MKKVLIGVLVAVVTMEMVLLLMFSSTGNALLLPYINNYLTNNVKGAKVELKMLNLKPGFVMAIAKVNDTMDLKLQGPIDLLSQRFNLAYKIDALKVEGKGFTLQKPLHITGRVKGESEDMHVTGKGEAFTSLLTYDMHFIKSRPQNILLHIKDASIAEILALGGQKNYAKGKLSLHIDMPTLDSEHPNGKAKIEISEGILIAEQIKKEFNIALSENPSIKADISAIIKDNSISASGEIGTSLGTITSPKTLYKLEETMLYSKYQLTLPALDRLESLAQIPLWGKLDAEGILQYKDKTVSATATTASLGGTSALFYKGDTLDISLKDIESSALLSMLKQPKITQGEVEGTIRLKSIKNMTGLFDLKTNGLLNTPLIKETYTVDMGEAFEYTGTLSGQIKEQQMYAQTKWKTTMGVVDIPDIVYRMNDAKLNATYQALIPDMGKLQPLTQRRYRGDMEFSGSITGMKPFVLSGNGKEFGGTVAFRLGENHLNAEAKGATVSKVMTMLDYPTLLEAMTEARLDYNLETRVGDVDATLDGARFLPNTLTHLIKEFTQFDLSKQTYNNTKFIARITEEIIYFKFDAKNKRSAIKVPKGLIGKRDERIDLTVALKVDEKDLQSRVTGTLQSPNVKIDSSEYLKSNAAKEVDKLLDKHKTKLPNGIDKDQVSGLLKSFL